MRRRFPSADCCFRLLYVLGAAALSERDSRTAIHLPRNGGQGERKAGMGYVSLIFYLFVKNDSGISNLQSINIKKSWKLTMCKLPAF